MKKSSLFLLELILMTLVFSVCAAICVSILGKAWSISRDSERLTQAVYLAETTAAHLQAQDEAPPETQGEYEVTWDSDTSLHGVVDYEIRVFYQDELVYSLLVSGQEVDS